MKKTLSLLAATLALASAAAVADPATEKEVTQLILDGNAYVTKHLKGEDDDYSKHGALEFWSSGGLLNEIGPGGRPGKFDSFDMEVKHIRVLTLVPGQAAVAHFYSEGSMKPEGFPAVTHYLTRVTQVYVKEDGKWKIRSSHWSPITGGTGTSQTALKE